MSKREFAGYWEYVLDEAIFTMPPHPSWGGAACIGADGRVQGVGSLFVQEARGEGIASQGNMIVPIDLLTPILYDLVTLGRVDRPPRPWLGMYTSEAENTVFVAGVASGGPAIAPASSPAISCSRSRAPGSPIRRDFPPVWAVGPAGSRDPAHHRPRRRLARVASAPPIATIPEEAPAALVALINSAPTADPPALPNAS